MVSEPVADDHRLVAAVRQGDDRAFEALYGRYQRRIQGYVLGMVKDHGRAEDITQEVFVSAVRRMRETERPIAFKPWIYEIAKNACIDQFRRSRRAEEISLEADEGLAPADYGRLVGSDPTPEVAVAAKQDLDHLCGAFGGLSDTHHEILVLRELEGMSYREIGERMGMSRPAVESTLFRARRRLTEEYDELVSGARCRRIQSLITMAVESRLGTREARRLSRHVAHCQPCRRTAMAAGLDEAILTHVPLRKRAAAKVGALLPFPLFGRGRGGGSGDASMASGAGSGWAAHLPMLSEQLAGPWAKLATAAVVLVAGAGAAGVGTQVVADDAPSARGEPPAAAERTATAGAGAGAQAGQGSQEQATQAAGRGGAAGTGKAGAENGAAQHGGGGSAAGGGGSSGASQSGSGGGGGGLGGVGGNVGRVVPGNLPQLPGGGSLPGGGGSGAGGTVQGAADDVGNTVNGAAGSGGGAVNDAANDVGGTVNGAANDVGGTANEAAHDVGGTANGAANDVGDTVNGAANDVGGAANGAANDVGGAANGAANDVGGTVNGAADDVGGTVNGAAADAGGAVNDAAGGASDTVGGVTGGLP
jgi:RNA polymerase sigma factor (sigma-70 family)